MLKDFFEIENKQKSTLLTFIGLTLISFLQLFIFKQNLFSGNFLIVVGISLSLALCWTILNIFPLTIILSALAGDSKLIYENVIFGSGILIIAGQILLTYVGYKNHYKFSTFIDFVWHYTLGVYFVIFFIIIIANRFSPERKNRM